MWAHSCDHKGRDCVWVRVERHGMSGNGECCRHTFTTGHSLPKYSSLDLSQSQLENLKKISCGRVHTTALSGERKHPHISEDGRLVVCGSGKNGVLGNGDITNTIVPFIVDPEIFELESPSIVDVCCGLDHCLALVTSQ